MVVSSLKTFGAFSGSGTSASEFDVPTLRTASAYVVLLFYLNFRLSVIFLLKAISGKIGLSSFLLHTFALFSCSSTVTLRFSFDLLKMNSTLAYVIIEKSEKKKFLNAVSHFLL